jgi:hypothetical protein
MERQKRTLATKALSIDDFSTVEDARSGVGVGGRHSSRRPGVPSKRTENDKVGNTITFVSRKYRLFGPNEIWIFFEDPIFAKKNKKLSSA